MKLAEMIRNHYLSLMLESGMETINGAALLKERCLKVAKWLTAKDGVKNSLMILGGVGTGKTTLLQAVKRTLWGLNYCSVMYRKATDLAPMMIDDADRFRREICGGSWCRLLLLDDVGTEAASAYKFKEELNPFVSVIAERYDKGLSMIITSNLKGTDGENMFSEYYGIRTADRMRQMFNTITFGEQSYRK